MELTYKKYKRIFLLICDSLGIGYDPHQEEYDDKGANTYLHIAQKMGKLNIPNLNIL